MLEEFRPSDDPAIAEARDRSMGETVAVKWLRPSEGDDGAASLCAVVREARCLDACLGHPSILQLKGMASDDKTGDLFIVTEPLFGSGGGGASTLRSRLTRPFSEAETRVLMRQLLGAAETMHGAGVTHRDINPGQHRRGQWRIYQKYLGGAGQRELD
jgi:cell division cycle 2-like protein